MRLEFFQRAGVVISQDAEPAVLHVNKAIGFIDSLAGVYLSASSQSDDVQLNRR
ncbi:hypothetical protein MJ588_19490 [Klebsiella pneumoniae]|nr:hypothetical protein MJ588_19490 [Klebsiella pneumoniae]